MTTTKRFTLGTAGLLLLLGLGAFQKQASAREYGHHFSAGHYQPGFQFGLSIGRPHQHERRTFLPGHYETRCEQVLVSPERCERQYVPPVYSTHYDRHGCAMKVLVRPGYWTEVRLPARYEERRVQVWVPGCYR